MSREKPPASHAPKRKRALTHVGGAVSTSGDPKVAELLAHALDVGTLSSDEHVHGFHSYPARMHWATAARVLEGLVEPDGRVLDPFVGSGTVAVEARRRGCFAGGIDLNPLAVELARAKSDPLDAERRTRLYQAASHVAELSEQRVRERVPVRAQLPPGETRFYQVHILKEMAGLFEEISVLETDWIRTRLLLVFSSLVVKFSKQRSDTDEREVERSLRKGLVTEFFLRKTREFCERLEAFEPLAVGPKGRIVEGDARAAHELFRERFDLVLSSPPYGGTYDYVSHHARRFAWLGIDARRFERSEIGARRRSQEPMHYAQELFDALSAMARASRKEAWIVLFVGDGQHEGQRLFADELVAQMAEELPLAPIASAAQTRPDFTGGSPRREHLLALRRS